MTGFAGRMRQQVAKEEGFPQRKKEDIGA